MQTLIFFIKKIWFINVVNSFCKKDVKNDGFLQVTCVSPLSMHSIWNVNYKISSLFVWQCVNDQPKSCNYIWGWHCNYNYEYDRLKIW